MSKKPSPNRLDPLHSRPAPAVQSSPVGGLCSFMVGILDAASAAGGDRAQGEVRKRFDAILDKFQWRGESPEALREIAEEFVFMGVVIWKCAGKEPVAEPVPITRSHWRPDDRTAGPGFAGSPSPRRSLRRHLVNRPEERSQP